MRLGKNLGLRFSYKKVRNSKREFINIQNIANRKTQLPSPYCSPLFFKVIFHHINPARLLWALLFIVFMLQHNTSPRPCLLRPPTIWHMRVLLEYWVKVWYFKKCDKEFLEISKYFLGIVTNDWWQPWQEMIETNVD